MALPWEPLETVPTAWGPLTLQRRGDDDFLMKLGARVLMTSRAHRSEVRLAELACEGLASRRDPRVLIGGLGMGFTLRAALERLPVGARIEVAEIEAAVLRWCQGPLAGLTGGAVGDPRVQVRIDDVARVVDGARERYDAIALDLFEGPRGDRDEADHPLYGRSALDSARRALRRGGTLAVWSESPAPPFEKRLRGAGFEARIAWAGRGGRRHPIYVARLA